MNTHELLENAALDALGLLDADEREAFEAAFRAAAPGVQAQVRREQLRMTRADAILPAAEPPLGLRARVIAAVREAMQTVAVRKAAVGSPALRRTEGVSSLWRIGAVASMAAVIVIGFVAVQIRNDNQQMRDSVASGAWNDYFLHEYGVKFDQTFFDPSTRLVSFVPSNPEAHGARGRAALLLDSNRKVGHLYCKDLPAGEGAYEVVVVDKAGHTVKAIITFQAAPTGIKNQTIEGLDVESSQTLAIRRVGSDDVMLMSRGL